MNQDLAALDAWLSSADIGETVGVSNATHAPSVHQPVTHQEQSNMNTPIVEIKTLVNGVDVAKASKDQLVDMLKKLEAEETELSKIRTTTRTVTARIRQIQSAQQTIAAALDADMPEETPARVAPASAQSE